VTDQYGRNPLDEARREGRFEVVDFLVEHAVLYRTCSQFESGLLAMGYSSAVGSFVKKFEDLKIVQANLGWNRTLLDMLLMPPRFENASASQVTGLRTFRVFLSIQELYIYQAMKTQIGVFRQTYEALDA
jgi:hypothetical protein